MMSEEVKTRLKNACILLKEKESYLTELDSKFGDGDHGVTISKISDFISKTIEENPKISLKELFTMIGNGILSMGAGSVSSLWGMLFTGMSEGIVGDTITSVDFKNMLEEAKKKLDIITNAQIGDKTLMDAFLPALEVSRNSEAEIDVLLDEVAQAAEKGAEECKNYIAKFGRFRSYGEQTIGTPDPGAISMSLLFRGFATKSY